MAGDTAQGIDVGDAVLTFLADSTQLDAAFQRLPGQADAAMSAVAKSVDKVGVSVDGVGDELGALGPKAETAAGDTTEAAQRMDYSFREARGSIALTAEELGVHLPRELTMLLAHIPLVGAAFTAMLPLVGVFAAIAVIGELIVKHEQMLEAVRQETEASETLSIKQQDLARGLQAANLQLEDQIRKLEGRPATNQLQIALINVQKAVDELVTTYSTDFAKMDKEIEDQFGLWGKLKRGAMDAALALDALTSDKAEDDFHAQLKANDEMIASLHTVIAAEEKLNEARRKLADTDPAKDIDAWKAAAGAVAIAAGEVQKAADATHAAVAVAQPDAHKLLASLTDRAIEARGEWKAIAEEITRVGLEAKKANQEIANEAGKAIEQSEKEKIAATKQGSQERIAVIDAALEEEKAKGLQGTQFYKALQIQKVEAVKAAAAAATEAFQESEKEQIAATKQGSQERVALIDAMLEAEEAKGLQDTKFYKSLQTQKIEAVRAELAAEEKVVEEHIALARTDAQRELADAKADAANKLTIVTNELKEEEARLQLKEQTGLLTQKQVLTETEALQRKATDAKIEALREEAAAQKLALDIEEQALKAALTQITDENEYAKVLDRILAIEQQRVAIAQKLGTEQHAVEIQGQTDLAKTQAKIEQVDKSWAQWVAQMKKDMPSLGQAIRADLQGAIDKFNKQFSADFANMIVTGKGFGKAMKSLGQDIAKDFISMLTEMLLKWVETQIAMKVLGISSSKATASGEIGAAAAAAGANMVASWSAAPWPIDTAAPAMGAMAYADAIAYQGLVALATGGLVTGPTLAMFGEKGDEAVLPLTDPVAMERISNALLSQPAMRVASAGLTNPSAIAAAANIRQGGFDDASMAKLADHIGTHLDRSGGAAGDTHMTMNVKGMISPDNMGKVMRLMSRRVQNRQSTLHASNSLRVTRRSQ